MSVLIDSEDVESGFRYDGVWHLHSSIKGEYSIVDQLVEVGVTPWMWADCNQIKYEIDGFTYHHHLFRDLQEADAETSTNKITLASYIQTSLQDQSGELPLGADPWSVTCVYNFDTDTFDVQFSMVTELIWSESTCAGLFNKLQDSETGTFFQWSAANVTNTPRYLFLKIAECTSTYITDNNTTPSLVLSGENYTISGQNIMFLDSTDTLTIKVYLPNISLSPVPLKTGWEMLLVSSFT
jgi:hypothetical protein